jgi:hypothetical protein
MLGFEPNRLTDERHCVINEDTGRLSICAAYDQPSGDRVGYVSDLVDDGLRDPESMNIDYECHVRICAYS